MKRVFIILKIQGILLFYFILFYVFTFPLHHRRTLDHYHSLRQV